MRDLRPHQEKALDMLRESLRSGHNRPMIQAPTGFGKTRLAAEIVNGARRKGKRIAFLVPALSLIDQTIEAFQSDGVDVREIGVIQGNHPMQDWSRPIQICSVQTVERRAIPEVDLALFDEAHRQFEITKRWLTCDEWAGRKIIGLSATPWSKGLGKFYDDLLIPATTQELITAGYLSDFTVYAPSSPDLTGVKTVAGDYHEGQLSEAMRKNHLVGDVVSAWLEKGPGEKTLAFAVDLPHAREIHQAFTHAGVSADFIHAKTERDERLEIGRKFHSGDIKVVVNVGTLTTGIDWDVRCLCLARPTKSEILFVQIIGRGLRKAEGKDRLLILDHSDNHKRLGFVTDITHDTLDMGAPKEKSEKLVREPRICAKCGALQAATIRVCHVCGHESRPLIRNFETIDGELAEMERRGNGTKKGGPKGHVKIGGEWIDERQFFAMLQWHAQDRGWKPGWAAQKYKEATKVWPRGMNVNPTYPSASVQQWIANKARQRAIAFAEAKEKERANV
jgi:DNA repair protein RadD